MRLTATEFKAFLNYMTRVKGEIGARYRLSASQSNDANISKLAYKEWMCLSESEKKYFFEPSEHSDRTSNQAFINFFTWNKEKLAQSRSAASDIAKRMSPMYQALSNEEKAFYSSLTQADYYNYKADRIIELRRQLRDIYKSPEELMLLEMVAHSKPQKPLTTYDWFTRSLGGCPSSTSTDKWKSLSEEERYPYQKQHRLDQLRYTYEYELWRTRFLLMDIKHFNFEPEMMLNCKISPEDLKKVVLDFSHDLHERIFRFYQAYIVSEYFLLYGENSIHAILTKSTQGWHNLSDNSKSRYTKRFISHLRSREHRLKRLAASHPQLCDKMILLDNLISRSQVLADHKHKLQLNRKDFITSSKRNRIDIIGQLG